MNQSSAPSTARAGTSRRRDPGPPLDALSAILQTSSASVLANVADTWALIGPAWRVATLTPEIERHLEFLYHFAGHDDRGVRAAARSRATEMSAAQGKALVAYVNDFDDVAFGYGQGVFEAGVEAMPDPWPTGASSPHRSPDEPPQ